jgi:uncharacterized protein (TIGR02145 family)
MPNISEVFVIDVSGVIEYRDKKHCVCVSVAFDKYLLINTSHREIYDDFEIKSSDYAFLKLNNRFVYGRLYDWATAMNISSFYNSTEWGGSDVGHQGICPTGWHLPSRGEWEEMVGAVGENAGTKLKAATGWCQDPTAPIGTDDFGFSALPSGLRFYIDSNFILDCGWGGWWAVTANEGLATSIIVTSGDQFVYMGNRQKDDGISIRCVQN